MGYYQDIFEFFTREGVESIDLAKEFAAYCSSRRTIAAMELEIAMGEIREGVIPARKWIAFRVAAQAAYNGDPDAASLIEDVDTRWGDLEDACDVLVMISLYMRRQFDELLQFANAIMVEREPRDPLLYAASVIHTFAYIGGDLSSEKADYYHAMLRLIDAYGDVPARATCKALIASTLVEEGKEVGNGVLDDYLRPIKHSRCDYPRFADMVVALVELRRSFNRRDADGSLRLCRKMLDCFDKKDFMVYLYEAAELRTALGFNFVGIGGSGTHPLFTGNSREEIVFGVVVAVADLCDNRQRVIWAKEILADAINGDRMTPRARNYASRLILKLNGCFDLSLTESFEVDLSLIEQVGGDGGVEYGR